MVSYGGDVDGLLPDYANKEMIKTKLIINKLRIVMSDASIRIMTLLDDLEEILASTSKGSFSEKAIVDSDEIRGVLMTSGSVC